MPSAPHPSAPRSSQNSPVPVAKPPEQSNTSLSLRLWALCFQWISPWLRPIMTSAVGSSDQINVSLRLHGYTLPSRSTRWTARLDLV